MSLAAQALAVARLQTGQGTPDERARLAAWDRLHGLLSTLDSKTSVLLRFNAIVVAALAYVLIVSGADPFQGGNVLVGTIGKTVGHLSLIATIVSCGFTFPVINVESGYVGELDDATLERKAALVARRTGYYAWAWRLAVAGGAGFAVLVGLASLHLK